MKIKIGVPYDYKKEKTRDEVEIVVLKVSNDKNFRSYKDFKEICLMALKDHFRNFKEVKRNYKDFINKTIKEFKPRYLK